MPYSAAPAPEYNAALSRERNEIGLLIRAERKKLGLTQGELAEQLEAFGVRVKTAAVAKWENGDNVPSAYQLLALCRVLHCQREILSFAGPAVPADLSAEGYRFLNAFRDFLAASERYGASRPPEETQLIEMRVFDLPASAGSGSLLDSDRYEIRAFPAEEVPRGADFGVLVSGDSMEPAYHDGQIAWVRSCEKLNEGDIGVFFYDGCSYLKEYHEEPAGQPDTDSGVLRPLVCWHSLNPDYPDVPVLDGRYQVFGRVLN